MAELDDIRQGLAALLRDVLPADEGQVSAYLLESPTPPSIMVAGVESDGMERLSFGGSKKYTIVIEAWLGVVSSIGSQKLLNRLLSEDAVAEAVESDSTQAGALFSRLQDDGTILTAQPAAADSVAFLSYGGQSRFTKNQAEYLLASWTVEVVTP